MLSRPVLTVHEIADLLKVKESTIRSWSPAQLPCGRNIAAAGAIDEVHVVRGQRRGHDTGNECLVLQVHAVANDAFGGSLVQYRAQPCGGVR